MGYNITGWGLLMNRSNFISPGASGNGLSVAPDAPHPKSHPARQEPAFQRIESLNATTTCESRDARRVAFLSFLAFSKSGDISRQKRQIAPNRDTPPKSDSNMKSDPLATGAAWCGHGRMLMALGTSPVADAGIGAVFPVTNAPNSFPTVAAAPSRHAAFNGCSQHALSSNKG